MRTIYKQRERKYDINVAKFILKRNEDSYGRYSGKVPVINNSIIAIKTDQRDNICSGKCKHSDRFKYKRKHYASIKLMLQHHAESYTNSLVIK